ncbi:MAG: beta-ketoacyl-ACP synthase II [Chloroflexi bacterium]|nr:beta-ketoacyl-ACP synthase II [Chloroflexota bacterium]MCI0802951.1 beta-ketoacyl-ACP synthase II [Chloroflexota bacterium]MCI0807628.1 beta-ketoacyl-ACP synthase II [Chloroflexota bacterium]MCI0850493.1 beta-ketoacyl-ACP synthase II [Chloroflexota bacterium]MCI0880591.1 beta-ketoacyl-ACP synthase II [Chloroflexota bacterium]
MTNDNGNRVVITGMGAITCLGNSVDEFWTGLKNGRSGIREISLVSPDGFPCKVSGEIRNFDTADYMERKESRRMARFSQFAVAAAHQAVKDSGIDFEREDLDRVGVLIGSGSGGLPETDQQAEIRVTRGISRMSPYYIPMMLVNMAAANISHTFNLTGYTNTCVTACAASTQAIGEASEVIRRGSADVIVAGGTEAGICEIGMGGFSTMRALTTWEGDPSKASRPFDSGRDGFAPAEGSGMLIMESLKHATARGAHIYAEIAGWGVSADAYHLVQPHPEGAGAAKAMQRALENAGVGLDDIDYINAHGTSTPINDKSETIAIKRVFGERAYDVPISSTKSMVGHSLGASGSLEAIACISSIIDGILHPTINQDEPDPDCDLDYIPNVAREADLKIVMSNSFGFGGQNACLVIKKFAG